MKRPTWLGGKGTEDAPTPEALQTRLVAGVNIRTKQAHDIGYVAGVEAGKEEEGAASLEWLLAVAEGLEKGSLDKLDDLHSYSPPKA